MKILKKVLVSMFSVFVLLSAQAYGATVNEIKQAILKQSIEMGVEPAIMLSLAKIESGFRQEARGGNAVGVFQLLPATASRMGYNAYNLDENIKAGIKYYKNMYNMFGSTELALAAYNMGPLAVKRANNRVPASAQRFVSRVISDSKYFTTNKI